MRSRTTALHTFSLTQSDCWILKCLIVIFYWCNAPIDWNCVVPRDKWWKNVLAIWGIQCLKFLVPHRQNSVQFNDPLHFHCFYSNERGWPRRHDIKFVCLCVTKEFWRVWQNKDWEAVESNDGHEGLNITRYVHQLQFSVKSIQSLVSTDDAPWSW